MRKQKNQETIKLNHIYGILAHDISFEVFSTKNRPKYMEEENRGMTWKFDDKKNIGSIWYMDGDYEAFAHECVHLAHHIIKLGLVKIPKYTKIQYEEKNLPFGKEETLCYIAGQVIEAAHRGHWLKYQKKI